MKKIKRKYLKIWSAASLLVYVFFLFTAAFHSHHLEYFSNVTFTDKHAFSLDNEPLNCIFNQISRPTYFYSFTQPISLDNNTEVFVTLFPISELTLSQTYHSTVNLRAPPSIS